jgi:hypothetical protein
MNSKRLCVFCGNKPEFKNNEHILPQWLLKLTGNPKRTVNFGIDYKTGETIRFDWTSLQVPSCKGCNEEFSDLENRSKDYILAILDRKPLTSIEYSDFMDWLDKVRTGLWLNYMLIQGNPTNIKPNFHIKSRLGQKDRMIAIYPIEGDEKGLNLYGAESLIFQSQPSCLGLRINNILIFNMSSDYLFSARSRFPYPKVCYTALDGDNPGMMHVTDFKTKSSIKHPLIKTKIFKPSIHLYQPIMAKTDNKKFESGYMGNYWRFDPDLADRIFPPYPSGKGKLYFQHIDRVELIDDVKEMIHFQAITKKNSVTLLELHKQVYKFQIEIYESNEFRANDHELLKNLREVRKETSRHCKKTISLLK